MRLAVQKSSSMEPTLPATPSAFTDDAPALRYLCSTANSNGNGGCFMTDRTQDVPTRTIRVAHSPDSDDAFMFYALSQDKFDTGNLRFVHELSDIESLNRRALTGELEVSAVSIHAYAYISERQALRRPARAVGGTQGRG